MEDNMSVDLLEDIKTKKIKLGNPVQIGLVVKDAYYTAELLKAILGIEQFRFVDWPVDPLKMESFYRGKPCKWRMILAFANYNNIEIELVQPIAGENGYNEFVERVGQGIHHLLFEIDNLDDVEQEFNKLGIETLMGGTGLRTGTRFIYLDTIPLLGWSIELRSKIEGSDGTSQVINNQRTE